jgi:NAD(P)H-dependent FMN reductase
MTNVGVILASVRPVRRGEAFAKWIMALLAAEPDVKAELLDLKAWPIPPFAEGTGVLDAEDSYAPGSLSRRWLEITAAQDAFIIVTCEYNRGYPGQLKNALDHVYTPWNRKPVGFVGYGGSANGLVAVQQLVQVTYELRMAPIRDAVGLGLHGLAVDADGFPTSPLHVKRAHTMIHELLWWSGALKAPRAARPA